jgi:hypothetical protein
MKTRVTMWGVALLGGVWAQAVEVVYPVDVGVIDVTAAPWNLDNTGVADVTAQLQQLVDETIPRKTWLSPEGYWPKIIYFPDGVYRLTDSVVGAILDSGAALGGLVIQGQSRDGVVLRLDDNAAGFGDPANRKYLLDYFAGNGTNNAFVNRLENVTIDVGSGNPGAVGVRFHANNTGAVRNVRIVSTDPELAGYAGLEAVKNTNGPWLIRGLEVVGFDYGLNLGNGQNARHMVSAQDLRLEGQRLAGIQLSDFILMAVNGSSRNTVPFVLDRGDASMVTLLGMDLRGEGEAVGEVAAIESASPVFLRDVAVAGYASVVRGGGEVLLAELPEGTEWHSHPRNFLWEETPDQSLGLPVAQAPELEWPDAADWAVVDSLTFEDDDTRAIREAMASGKSAIFFKPQTYRVSDTIRIPPHVRLIAGQFATIRPDGGLKGDGGPLFEWGPSQWDTVVLDKIKGAFDGQANPNPLIRNAGHGTLVLRDIFWVSGPVYRSEPTRARVFFENAHSLPGTQNNPLNIPAYEIRGHDAWAYQWNPEMLFPHVRVDGGRFRAYGFKTGEMRGPMVEVYNHGAAEIFGGTMNVTHDHLDINPDETLILWSEDANISANFIEMAQLTGPASGWGRHRYVAVETRDGETRQLLNTDPSVMHRTNFDPQYGAVVNLYTGYFEQDDPANAAPSARILALNPDASGYTYRAYGQAVDPDSRPAAQPKLHWRVVSGPGPAFIDTHVGEQAVIAFERAGLYRIEASATDGALEARREIELRVLPRHFSFRFGRTDVNRYIDNFPQDGQTDLFHPALLQVGDDAANTHSHLKFEMPLAALKGSDGRIASARLRLRVDAVDQLESVLPSYTLQPGYGLHAAVDFQAERISLGTVSLAGRTAGDWVDVDIRDALVAAMQTDNEYLTIWLDAAFSNDGIANLARFTSTVAADASQRPELVVDFTPPGLAEGAIALGGAGFRHPVFGDFFDLSPWIHHLALGWLYVAPEVNPGDALIVHSPRHGWLYTRDTFYPWVYAYATGQWFEAGADPSGR